MIYRSENSYPDALIQLSSGVLQNNHFENVNVYYLYVSYNDLLSAYLQITLPQEFRPCKSFVQESSNSWRKRPIDLLTLLALLLNMFGPFVKNVRS